MTSGTSAFPASATEVAHDVAPQDLAAAARIASNGAVTSDLALYTDDDEGAAPGAWKKQFLEFMVVGGATLLLFPLSWLVRRTFGPNPAEYAVGFATFYAAYVINDPHFAVTYLLFYKDVGRRATGDDYPLAYRVRYWIAGFAGPALLVAWALSAIANHSAESLGGMVQLMYLLVGWHYVKQGFGVLAVLSARRGVRITARERTVILAHCFAGWAYAWASPAGPPGEFEEKGVVYHALGHPRSIEIVTGVVLATSTVALVAVLAARWRRERRLLPLAPLTGLLVTVWSWTIFSSADRLVQYMIPALHSIQYLYFVGLMKRNEARAAEGPPLFGRPAAVRLGFLAMSALGLGFILFHGAPAAFDGLFTTRPGRGAVARAVGPTPFFAAIFVIVNIHHYLMDHVIWRRDNPEMRYLREAVPAPVSSLQ
jgi:hypothetical protein